MSQNFRKILNKSYLLCLPLSLILLNFSYAADLPNGVKLSKNQVLNRGNGAEIPTIDPQKIEDVQAANVGLDVFEGLVRYNSQGILKPAGATDWTISKDGLTYIFHLRKNSKWSNGDIITAHDYVYGFQRLVDPKTASSYAFIVSSIKNAELISAGKEPLNKLGVVALNDYTLQISLNEPTPYLFEILTLSNCVPANKNAMDKKKDQFFQAGNLVSNGPYILKYWKVGDKITLVKNQNYWNAKKTIIEEVHFYPTQNLTSEEQMYEAGQLDITNEIPMDKYDSLKRKLTDEVKTNPALSSYWFSFNLDKPPFKDNIKLRKALSLVIDREIITKKVTMRGEKPIYDIVAIGTKNYNQFKYDWSDKSIQDRIQLAKKLYEEAGYSADKPLNITILYNTNDNSKKLVLALASMWKQTLGVNAVTENQEWKVFLNSRNKGEFDVVWNRWIADYNDANTFADLSRSDSEMNTSKFKNPKYDELLKLAKKELDLKKRQKILEEASALMMNTYPIVPLYSAVTTHLVKKHVGGYTGKNPQDSTQSFELYIKDHEQR
jgi:oligopeptide transport system substrate-binding protein